MRSSAQSASRNPAVAGLPELPSRSGFGVRLAALLLAAGMASCDGCGDPSEPGGDPPDGATATTPVLLSTGSPTKDEDPSVLLAANGRVYVAWFSDRGNNNDIYVASTADHVTWSAPVRVTSGPGGDFYPNLIQDSQGTFHLVWFQWVALLVGQIRHATSPDGTTWSAEEAVTTDLLVDDWVPSIAQAPDGSLLVAFVAAKRDAANPANQIWLARKRSGQPRWDAPVLLPVNSAPDHDHLPFLARTGPAQLTLVWVRYSGNADFITNSRSDLWAATSPDGSTWSTPARVTTDGRGQNLFPQTYRRHDGSWWLLWLSTRSGEPRLYEIPLADIARYPAAAVENRLLPPGYSHRLTATPAPREYLAAWVQGAEGAQDIYYRLITR